MSYRNQYDDNDAALARALQEEYEREYRRRSLQQHLGQPDRGAATTSAAPSAPPEAIFGEPFYNEPAPAVAQRFNAEPEYSFDPAPDIVIDAHGSVEMSDEAYARRIEQQFYEEELERQRQQRMRAARNAPRQPTPPRTRRTSTATTSQQHARARSNSRSRRNAPPSRSNSGSNRDSAMQRQMSSRSSSRGRAFDEGQPQRSTTRNAPHPSRSNSRSRNSRDPSLRRQMSSRSSSRTRGGGGSYDQEQPLPMMNSGAVPGYVLDDEELAQRMEQEERDAQLAREWIAQEQMQSSAARAQAAQRQSCCSCRRLISCCLSLIIVLISVALVLYFLVFNNGENNWWNDPNIFGGEDPFNNANPEDANLWKTNSPGLELTIINALDSEWSPYFYTAVQQWDNGSPDALQLTTQETNPESVCDAKRGVIKVCNGNYGATNWRGINKVLLENGWIYASAARMNEYYFGTDGDGDQRQYTMCHEIGHGFGLPHTDEDFTNKDLGNCMDYTNRPGNNKQPAEANFMFLAQLYGTIDGSPIPDTVEAAEAVNNTNEPKNDTGDAGKGKNGGRTLSEKLPPAVAAALEDVDMLIDSGLIGTENEGWRKLHESPHGEAHEIDLGDGFTVQLHLLKKAQGDV